MGLLAWRVGVSHSCHSHSECATLGDHEAVKRFETTAHLYLFAGTQAAVQAAAQAAPQEGEKNNTESGASPEKPAISSVEGGADEDMDKKESMEEGGGSPKDSPSSSKKRTRQASQSGSELQGDGTPGKGSKEIMIKEEVKKPDPKSKRKHTAGK